MDIHKSCGITVFENEEQAKLCANSRTTKKGVAVYMQYMDFL